MKDKESWHKRVQELIDCYATNDPLQEMSRLPVDSDTEEAALKWLALAALHGVNANASKITLTSKPDGSVTVTAKYRKSQLPSPGGEIGRKIVAALRGITHIEESKGKTALALGMRDSSLELKVKVKSEAGADKIVLKFPE
jgi:hypothetical protein